MRGTYLPLLILVHAGCAEPAPETPLVTPCPVGGIALLPMAATLTVGDTVRGRVVPGAATCSDFALRVGDRFIWRSSDTTVALVDSLGLVVALGPGEATVRATAARDFSASAAAQVVVR